MTSENANQVTVGLPAGTRIGKYEIKERLAIGGQSIVYKGYDPLLDRFVAIKQVSAHLAADGKFLERFRREAQILAKLGSEQSSIVMIYEMIQDERGLFIVMEHVEGHTIEQSLRDNPGPVEVKAVLAILWRLAAGLHAVHQAGIIHRDIKPGNIIIGQGLKTKIADFGVAASSSGQTSMVLGTTKYMAPELYSSKSTDGRVDIYSLGFIAYEMLIGRAKLNELFEDVVCDKHSEAMRWMKWHGNEKLSLPPAHEINPAVPTSLSEIVAKMTAKDARQRYASMEELGRELKTRFGPKGQASGNGDQRGEQAAKADEADKGKGARIKRPLEPELVIPDLPPATAPLPARQRYRRLIIVGIVVAAVVVVGLMALAVRAVVNAKAAERQAQEQAQKTFADANQAYESHKFKAAIAGFDDVMKKYGGTDNAAKAGYLVHMAKAKQAAQQAMAATGKARNPFWEQASDEQDQAASRLKVLQTRASLADYAQKESDNLKSFDLNRGSSRLFYDAMDKSRDLLAKGKFDEARGVIRSDNLARMDVARPGEDIWPAKDPQVLTLRRQIDQKEFQTSFDLHVQAAREAIKARKYDLASEELTQTTRLLASELANSIEPTAKARFNAQVKELRKSLEVSVNYNSATQQAGDLLKDGEKAEAVAQLKIAYGVTPSKELADEIARLHSEIAYEEGLELAKAGKKDQAKAKFDESLKYLENAPARTELEKLSKSQELSGILTAADEAFEKGDFATALVKYQQAHKIDSSNTEVAQKIKECQFNVKLEQAKKLAAARKYDEAAVGLAEIRKLMPDRAGEVDALWDGIKKDRAYELLIAEAKAAMAGNEWSKAREALGKAKAVKATAQVETLLAQANYSDYLGQGKAAMKQGLYSDAVGYFTIAQKYSNSDEVRKLISEAQQKAQK